MRAKRSKTKRPYPPPPPQCSIMMSRDYVEVVFYFRQEVVLVRDFDVDFGDERSRCPWQEVEQGLERAVRRRA